MLSSTAWKHFSLRGGTAPTFNPKITIRRKKNSSKTSEKIKPISQRKTKRDKKNNSDSCLSSTLEFSPKYYNRYTNVDYEEELKDCQGEVIENCFVGIATENNKIGDTDTLCYSTDQNVDSSLYRNYQESLVGKDAFMQVNQYFLNQPDTSDRPAAAVGGKRSEIWNNSNGNFDYTREEKRKKSFKDKNLVDDFNNSPNVASINPAAYIDNGRGLAAIPISMDHLPSTAPRIITNMQTEDEFQIGEPKLNDGFSRLSHKIIQSKGDSKEQYDTAFKDCKEERIYYSRNESEAEREVAAGGDATDVQAAEGKEEHVEAKTEEEFKCSSRSSCRNYRNHNERLSQPSLSPKGEIQHHAARTRRPNSCDSQISRPNLYSSYFDNDSDSVCSQSTMNSMGSWGSVGSKSVLYPVKMTAFDFGTLTYQNSNFTNDNNPNFAFADTTANFGFAETDNRTSYFENPAAKVDDASGLPSLHAAADISLHRPVYRQVNGRRPRSEASFRTMEKKTINNEFNTLSRYESNIPTDNCPLSSDLYFINNRPPSRQKNAFPVQLGAYKDRRKIREKKKSFKENSERDSRQSTIENYETVQSKQRSLSLQKIPSDSLNLGLHNNSQESRGRDKEHGNSRIRERRDSNNSNTSNESNISSSSRKNQSNRSRRGVGKLNSSSIERNQRERMNNISDDPMRDGFLILDELEHTKLQLEEVTHAQFPVLLNKNENCANLHLDCASNFSREILKSPLDDRIQLRNSFIGRRSNILNNNFLVDQDASTGNPVTSEGEDIETCNENEKSMTNNSKSIVLETNLEEEFLGLFATS